MRSIILRVTWAFTRFIFTSCGFAIPSFRPSGVISLKRTRRVFLPEPFTSSAMCQAIASPSRSGSVARKILSTFAARSFNFLIIFALPDMTTYSALKLSVTSTPNFFAGRSLMCPLDASTRNSFPKYRSIVRALDGDSTIMSDRFAIFSLSRAENIRRLLGNSRGKLRIYRRIIRLQ